MTLKIPIENQMPCDQCGQQVDWLIIGIELARNNRDYTANRNHPCGCFLAVTEIRRHEPRVVLRQPAQAIA